jgi:hypothetical protein
MNNFINVSLNEQNLILHYQFNKAIKLPFTDEIADSQLPKDIIECAKDFLNNLPSDGSMPSLDDRARNLVKKINNYYSSKNVFKDTKKLVKDTACPILRKLYSLQDNVFVIKEEINLKINEEINLKIKEEKSNLIIQDNSDTAISTIKPNNFVYLGLLIKNCKSKIFTEIICEAFKKFLPIVKNQKELVNLIHTIGNDNLPDNWNFPHSEGNIWHVTTLFKGAKLIDKSIENHPVYKEFQQNKNITVSIHGLVYIPNKTIFCIIKTPASVDNSFPHMTTLISGFKPKESNEVMKELFSKGRPNEKDYQLIISGNSEYLKCLSARINGMVYDCYIHKFSEPIILGSSMNAFKN